MSEDLNNEEIKDDSNIGRTLYPEGLIMMTVAIGFDVLGIFISLIPKVGLIISSVTDLTAFAFFGLWMLIKGKKAKGTKKTTQTMSKFVKVIKKSKWLKPAFMVINIIPVVGSLTPLWSVIVYAEIQD